MSFGGIYWVDEIKPSGFKNIRDLSYGVYLPAYFILGLCMSM